MEVEPGEDGDDDEHDERHHVGVQPLLLLLPRVLLVLVRIEEPVPVPGGLHRG